MVAFQEEEAYQAGVASLVEGAYREVGRSLDQTEVGHKEGVLLEVDPSFQGEGDLAYLAEEDLSYQEVVALGP